MSAFARATCKPIRAVTPIASVDRNLIGAILRLEELSRVRADRCVVVPHFAFHVQTPDEMYVGTGASLPATLKQKRDEARAARLAHNRAVTCARCKFEYTKPAMVAIGINTS